MIEHLLDMKKVCEKTSLDESRRYSHNIATHERP